MKTDQSSDGVGGLARLRLVAVMIITAFVVGIWLLPREEKNPDFWLLQGQTAFESGKPEVALHLANRVLNLQQKRYEAHLLAAEASAELGSFHAALGSCKRIPDTEGATSMRARLLAGDLQQRVFRRLDAAELEYRRALALDGKSAIAHYRLAYVLALQTRTDELIPHIIFLIQSRVAEVSHLTMLSVPHRLAPDKDILDEHFAEDPESLGVRLSLARRASLAADAERAKTLLTDIVRRKPDWGMVQGRLGRLLQSHGLDQEWELWHANLPPGVDHALIWESRGLWFQQQKQSQFAIRCFGEAVERDPNLITANYQLGQALIASGRPEDAENFLERAKSLQEYDRLLDVRRIEGQAVLSTPPFREVAELAESLGLLWEAFGWAQLASHHGDFPVWSEETMMRLGQQLEELPTERFAHNFHPIKELDFRNYPLPSTLAANSPGPESGDSRKNFPLKPARVPVHFRDVAAAAGIHFSYFNSANPERPGLGRIYEFTGGGIAVMDFDRDGWPDVYLSQGCRWPPQPGQREHVGELFRNRGNETFERVTLQSDLIEDGYSQGTTVGDFNNDGFSDLYVANIGLNRLFLNQGDGTFRDVTSLAGIEGSRWTTSCLLADLNGDGRPDIYDVNYLSGEDLLDRPCRQPDGTRNPCAPQDFQGEVDQCYLNLGDGRFENVSEIAGIASPQGKGLGIVCWQREGADGLDLFVANDGVPNFYYVNQSQSNGQRLYFGERALVSGLALNSRGTSEACMGIAAGDLDGDNSLDLFVTNFIDESNTLYRQKSPLLFTDETARAQLRKSSLRMLGFGTQAVDANLDGDLDLAVANGHIDDYSEQGVPYEMPAQFYRNEGKMKFHEQSADETGLYFSSRLLGRAMVKCDFNRDGLEDLIVSHLDAPVALLKNESDHDHRFLSLSLTGTRSARDAIGTRVTLQTPERTLTRELTAGDGYHASNERRLVFGLNQSTEILSVTITWPSGRSEVLRKLDLDSEWHVIENRQQTRFPVGSHVPLSNVH